MSHPPIVCLCGSTRFGEAFRQANLRETLAGKIVLSVGCYKSDLENGIQGDVKAALDTLHLRKIDLADSIHVLNVDGYIGESTQREIAYAVATHKAVTFLDSAAGESYLQEHSHALGRLVAGFVVPSSR